MQMFSQCELCKHQERSEDVDFSVFKCPAFPGGIPDNIIYGSEFVHDKPLRGQEGATVFEERDAASRALFEAFILNKRGS